MSVTKPPVEQQPPGPHERDIFAHPILALSLSVALATATGLLADWAAAATVFSAVCALFTARNR